ncbi:DUF485 domain-containing protein [Actinophytocola algeriensis]|uniref:Uncharacterized membrane protein (DUF485 family) n=1 Tax=Actinophytocola algeriensis TaxID=1768010 RepID=A0A7W7QBM6_9PSEU|nr:DUF485 domain-containing protein [Actinophytocola algeriensis]MBB4910181.1 uncharacterized membrane protein (DUF485 family) [Actinophytocola algeriensis]MBE1480830.1 uncharacterized membrane protein (DUF485 family) [Actinophytocola algeriensis]
MTQVVHTPITARAPEQAGAGFGGITTQHGTPPVPPDGPDYAAIHDSPQFAALRRRFRRFVFPMAALFFGWYLTYVLLAAYAHDFMSHRLFGLVTVGLVLGVLQFVSTIAITAAYVRFARRNLDPAVEELRAGAGVTDR